MKIKLSDTHILISNYWRPLWRVVEIPMYGQLMSFEVLYVHAVGGIRGVLPETGKPPEMAFHAQFPYNVASGKVDDSGGDPSCGEIEVNTFGEGSSFSAFAEVNGFELLQCVVRRPDGIHTIAQVLKADSLQLTNDMLGGK